MDEQSTSTTSDMPRNEWQPPIHWHGNGALRRFSISGWPAVALVGLAVIVLAGPALHLAFAAVGLVFSLLPLVIVGGLIFWGFRSLTFMTVGGSRTRHQARWHNQWRMRHGAHDERTERKNMDGIFYV